MPHKPNAARRHRIGKMKFKVTNWAEYEAGLRRRGSLTLSITPEAMAGWAAQRRKTRGGQPLYSDLAIETTLMLGMVLGWRLRQSEELLNSVLDVTGLALPLPDHTTLCRRARTWKPSARSNDISRAGAGRRPQSAQQGFRPRSRPTGRTACHLHQASNRGSRH